MGNLNLLLLWRQNQSHKPELDEPVIAYCDNIARVRIPMDARSRFRAFSGLGAERRVFFIAGNHRGFDCACRPAVVK